MNIFRYKIFLNILSLSLLALRQKVYKTSTDREFVKLSISAVEMEEPKAKCELTAAQKARIERNRLKAMQLRESKIAV